MPMDLSKPATKAEPDSNEPTPQELLQRAIDAGATFGEFLTLYAAKNTEHDRAFIAKARELHASEGQLEIDDNAICSGSEGGEYVLAWVWVDADDVDEDDGEGEEDADGWVFYDIGEAFVENLACIEELIGSTLYESKMETDKSWWIRRVVD